MQSEVAEVLLELALNYMAGEDAGLQDLHVDLRDQIGLYLVVDGRRKLKFYRVEHVEDLPVFDTLGVVDGDVAEGVHRHLCALLDQVLHDVGVSRGRRQVQRSPVVRVVAVHVITLHMISYLRLHEVPDLLKVPQVRQLAQLSALLVQVRIR